MDFSNELSLRIMIFIFRRCKEIFVCLSLVVLILTIFIVLIWPTQVSSLSPLYIWFSLI